MFGLKIPSEAVVKWNLKNSLFYKCRRTQGVEEFCLENREGCKSSRAFESFRQRGIIEKPSRGDTVLTNSLILYGSVANRQLRGSVKPFPSGVGRWVGTTLAHQMVVSSANRKDKNEIVPCMVDKPINHLLKLLESCTAPLAIITTAA